MAKILAQREKYNDNYIQQIRDNASAEAQAVLEGSEEYKALTGDLSKLGVEEARKALAAYRSMVESSADLSEEAKKEILSGLDEIQEKIDNIELDNLQQQFEDIQSVISSISSILGSFGASSELTEGLSGLSTVIGGLFTVLSSGSWVNKFSGIAAMIGGIVTVAKSLKGLFSDGNEDLTAGVTKLSTAYQKLVGIMNKAFGDNKTSLQNQAIDNIKAQIAEYQKLIDKELAKGNGFLARLFGLDTDEKAVKKYQQEIEKLFGDIAALEEEQKRDFLQTDTDSFVNSLRDIWAQSYDSAEDYYTALKKLNQTTIDDIIARWIEKKLVEDQVNNSLQKLYDSGLNDSSFELFSSEIQAISDAAKAEYERWQQAGYFQKETGESSMDGSIARTATEAQFNQYLGYIQNINITAHDILNAVKNQPVL
ncbi:MAG TPA: hypothetical protein PLL37_11480, partial [Bacillota bacterium]|nr:hypothetical protein [Bacillota bacterium]